MKRPGPACIVVAAVLVASAGCSSGTKKEISQTVARNAVAIGMKKEFSDHHHPLQGVPRCTTSAVKGSTTKVDISCSATTDKGEHATLVGRTSGANEVRGTFSGSVDGVPVFANDTCIGC